MKLLHFAALLSVVAALLLAARPAPAALTANRGQPSIPVSIQGVLLDYHGKPVNEGFLMLQGNPQLNALCGGDGRFRIEGKAWAMPDVLLASWAGCEVTRIPIKTAQVKLLTIRLKAQDPAFTKIETGISLKVRWTSFYVTLRPLTPAQRECIQAYDIFLKTQGNGIIDKMLAGTPLVESEQRYEFLLASEIWMRSLPLSEAREKLMNTTFIDGDKSAETSYCATVTKEFNRVTTKAIRGQRVTEADVHALRLMSAVYGSSGFDATSTDYSRILGSAPFPGVTTGEPLPFDVPFLRFSPLLKAPGWSDYTSLSATTHLRLEGIWGYLDSYWKWRVRDPNTLVQSPLEDWKKKYWQDWFQVTSTGELTKASHGKPVFILCSNFEDGTHPVYYTREIEYLRRAYSGVADVYHASQTSGTAFYDMWMDEWLFYGPNPKSDPGAGLDCARWEDDDYTPLRHARTDKLCAMEFPWVSGEILLDLPRGTSYLDNYVAFHHFVVLDRDGKVANPFPSRMWAETSSRFFADDQAYQTYQQLGSYGYDLFAPLHEQLLRGLVANGGRYEPSLFDHILVQFPQTFQAKDDVFVVKSVDKQNQVIHASWIPPADPKARFFYGSGPATNGTNPTGDFVLKLQPDTRFEVRSKDGKDVFTTNDPDIQGKIVYRLGSLGDFQAGDRFIATIRLPEPVAADATMTTVINNEVKNRAPAFDMARYDGKELAVERMMNYEHMSYEGGDMRWYAPLYGRVIKKDGAVFTLKINQDEVKQMWGYRFWKAEEGKGRAVPQAIAALNWPIVKRWGDGTEADRTYRFRIDGATDLYRNGLVAAPDQVSVGDYVFVEYAMWWETQNMQNEIISPERVQASEPMSQPAQ